MPKSGRLSARKEIERLFTCGEAFLVYPVKCTYRFRDENETGEAGNRMMVIAPKRNYKRAVDRNLLKRRMREAYRLHQVPLGADVAFSYVAKGAVADYRAIEKSIVSILDRLCQIRDRQTLAAETDADGVGE